MWRRKKRRWRREERRGGGRQSLRNKGTSQKEETMWFEITEAQGEGGKAETSEQALVSGS